MGIMQSQAKRSERNKAWRKTIKNNHQYLIVSGGMASIIKRSACCAPAGGLPGIAIKTVAVIACYRACKTLAWRSM